MSAGSVARIGPNAITQVAAALERELGSAAAGGFFEAAGLVAYLRAPPAHMVPESEVIALHAALRRGLAAAGVRSIARRAGSATGDYLLANRIPAPVQRVLGYLPRRIAGRVLLAAIGRHAWTFAGSGTMTAAGGRVHTISVEHCPICRGATAAAPLCDYYAATFERLYRALVSPGAVVIETECAAAGGTRCHFEIRID